MRWASVTEARSVRAPPWGTVFAVSRDVGSAPHRARRPQGGGVARRRPQAGRSSAARGGGRRHSDAMTRARIIGVAGGSGGVGATSLVAALAVRAARRGLAVACVDLRRFGGGLDVVFGIDHERAVRWPDLSRAHGELDVPELLARLPCAEGVYVVSCDRVGPTVLRPQACQAVVDGLAAHVDLVVVDLPAPGLPEHEPSLELLHEALLVCGSDPPALAAAGVYLRREVQRSLPWGLVQRVSRHEQERLPGVVASALRIPLVAVAPDDERVLQDLRRGRAPGVRGTLARTAEGVLDAVTEPMRRTA